MEIIYRVFLFVCEQIQIVICAVIGAHSSRKVAKMISFLSRC